MALTRRNALKGMFQGATVTLGLPFLETFSVPVLASTPAQYPLRFGTWIWGCGFIPEKWIPQETGTEFVLPEHLRHVEAFQQKMALLSGFDVKLDGVPNKPHVTGCLGLRTGIPVPNREVVAPTLDVLIGDQIGSDTRFRSLELSASGTTNSYSYRAASSPNPSETSLLAFYDRVFGEGFQDPNAAHFEPRATDLVQQSVLSQVSESRRDLMRRVSASDRARLEEYYDGLRQLEQQIALRLEPPAPVENFEFPSRPEVPELGAEMDTVLENHRLMSKLLARAVQANQTRIFNMLLSDTASNLRERGSTTTHHTLTHEEPVDATLGYQPKVGWFADQSMMGLRDFLQALDEIEEGEGTLLDHSVVLAHSDCSIAKSHAVEGIPVIVAGNGSGRVKTGQHIAGYGDPISRIGLTLQQAMGLPTGQWGTLAMNTDRTIEALIG